MPSSCAIGACTQSYTSYRPARTSDAPAHAARRFGISGNGAASAGRVRLRPRDASRASGASGDAARQPDGSSPEPGARAAFDDRHSVLKRSDSGKPAAALDELSARSNLWRHRA